MPDEVKPNTDDVIEEILSSIAKDFYKEYVEPAELIDPNDILLDKIDGLGLF